ncbi:FHA domain-containing protein [Paludisphaera soli]|uniref:FHA domain-containing protein n=1 Tax=Paludisphaera soli TaxID=2712865 RepID=UPI0013ED2DD5|nr:FHA domain-containing protein [Paludisphaera soli]
MNYTLQVVKGRSDVGALRLIDGVNSVGRHDDCVIRIRSSQVSRRHCEIFEADDHLMVRDLGSSNGTYVNGKRVLGQQPLKLGDVIGIGGVSLRVDPAGGPGAGAVEPGSDTAELEAVADAVEVDEADDFEVGVEVEEEDGFDLNLDEFPDAIPLDDEPKPEPAKPKKSAKKPAQPAAAAEAEEPVKEDDAVAQFLMDLKLDEDD